MRHRDPTGKPCLTVDASARARMSNPNLYEHVVKVTNSCAKLIKLQICYLRSQQCVSVEAPGRGRKEATLGLMPSMKAFRYEFRERF